MTPATLMVSHNAVPESGSGAFKESGKKGQFDNIERMEEKLGFNANVDIKQSESHQVIYYPQL